MREREERREREKREREKRWIVLNHREAKDKDLDPEHGA